MPHSVSLITTISVGLGLALVFGFIAARLKLPALVGYLVAGIIIGPSTPGFVGDLELAGQLAEIGVMLLMFGVGLHFSLDDLLSVRRIALPGAIVQIVVATAMGAIAALTWGWTLAAGIVFGLALSVASTVVLLRALESRGVLDTVNGRIAVGWLVVEDLVMVLVLVLLPALAGMAGGDAAAGSDPERGGSILGPGGADRALWTTLLITLGEVAVFIGLMLVVGRRLFPWLLWQVARTGSRELFTLCVIAAAVSIAYGSAALFGVSFALGAFFAGMVLRESALSYRAAEESLPLRDAFSVLFFISVGMLFEPKVIIEQPLHLIVTVLIIMLGKSLAAFFLTLAFRYPINTALTVSASLAQVGEFSFILVGLGVALKLLPSEGQSLVLAGALISIALNPLMFQGIAPFEAWIRARPRLANRFERPGDPLAELPTHVESRHVTDHVVLVGYGRVGRRIGEALAAQDLPLVVAEGNREIVERLRGRGFHAVAGDASEAAVLVQAHVARARILVIAIPDTFHVRQMIEIARTLNPHIQTVVRTHSEEEAELLRRENAGTVFLGEHELALSMTRFVIEQASAPPARVEAA
ncbi:MAG: YbaL family putative K(+) efflux transporter [Lautropia sp.]